MSINIGNSKIGKIYVGSTAIGEVYQGSTLVWRSGLRCYGFKSTSSSVTAIYYLIGPYSNSGYVIALFESLKDYSITISSITGTLGASNSKIKISTDSTNTYSYDSKVNINGIDIYVYFYETQFLGTFVFVLSGSKAGSYVAASFMNLFHPKSVTSSTMTFENGDSVVRDSSLDCTWKTTGFY